MNRIIRKSAALLLFLVCASALSGQAYVSVSIGHAGRVNQLVVHPEQPLAFSVGEDGRLLIWDMRIEGLRSHVQLASVPLTKIAHHPTRNQVAVFARDALTRGRILVWDWENEELLFEQQIDGVPQVIQYSPAGTFLVIATNDFDSVSFFSSQTGNVRPYLTEGFGGVGFVQIARSERNILTYIPTRGELIYWELQTGRELQTVETVRRLEQLTLIDPENQRLLAGYTDEALIVIDNLSGNELASLPISPISDIAYSESRNTLYVQTEQFGDPVVRAYRYVNGQLRPTRYRGNRTDTDSRTISAIDTFPTHELLSGSEDGAVTLYGETTGQPVVIGSGDYVRAEHVAFVDDRLTVTTGNRIISFETDLFTSATDGAANRVEMSFLRQRTTTMSQLASVRSSADGEGLLVWGSSVPGTIWRVDPDRSGARVVFERESAAPISTVRRLQDGLLVAFRDGLIVYEADDEEQSFEYQSSGVQDVVWDADIGLVIAQTMGTLFSSSIVVVDPRTGETVPVQTGAFLTTALELDEDRDTVYALSLTGEQGNAVAEITRYTGRGLGRSTRVFRGQPGHTSGDISWDAQTGTLFSTLQMGLINAVSGELDGQQALSARNPSSVTAGALVLASANSDGTVSLFWKETGRHLADIILFEEGWIVTAGRGFLTSDSQLREYLRAVPIGSGGQGTPLESLELNLPLILRPDF